MAAIAHESSSLQLPGDHEIYHPFSTLGSNFVISGVLFAIAASHAQEKGLRFGEDRRGSVRGPFLDSIGNT